MLDRGILGMMGTTHAALGLTVASGLLFICPELAVPAVFAAIVGGVFPDIDLIVGEHRKTLHYPVCYWFLAIPALVLTALVPHPIPTVIAFFLLSAAMHSATDILGAGVELRPWERTSDRVVYLHPVQRWLRPRWVVRYDGAPEDLLLTVVFAIPGLALYDGVVRTVTIAGTGLAVVYAVLRKRIPNYVKRFVE